jgi:hypothetical protein
MNWAAVQMSPAFDFTVVGLVIVLGRSSPGRLGPTVRDRWPVPAHLYDARRHRSGVVRLARLGRTPIRWMRDRVAI